MGGEERAGLWISTYTRNLQRQIVQEIARLYPDPAEREEKAVVRKGRENYLCLLNFEEAVKRTALAPGPRSVALALIARWIAATADGDMSGAGFPAFLAAHVPLREITDRRGECIYAACPHYRVCFIERAVRRARHAPHRRRQSCARHRPGGAGLAERDETTDTPRRAARALRVRRRPSSVRCRRFGFAAFVSGRGDGRAAPLDRGPEGRARSRMRGLEERLKDLVAEDESRAGRAGRSGRGGGRAGGRRLDERLNGRQPRGPGEVFPRSGLWPCAGAQRRSREFYSLEAGTERSRAN